MVLATPKVNRQFPDHLPKDDEELQVIFGKMLHHEVLRDGVIVSHLNFNHQILDEVEEYPYMCRIRAQEYLEFMERMDKNNPKKYYDKDVINMHRKMQRMCMEDLHNREAWKKVKRNEWFDGELDDRVLQSYGVCDSPEQLLELYDFDRDPRNLFILMTPMRKDEQPSYGGWRWHKWGPYVGYKDPQHEYLYDEEDIDKVYVYHIYEILD